MYQKCLKSATNGGALSCYCKAAAFFLDDVDGWDVQAGRDSIRRAIVLAAELVEHPW
jgi:hypothetical protein